MDAPYAWAGVYDRRLVDAGLLGFDEDLRTCEDRPWIWRLHLHARTFAVVGLHGVRYRRDVSASLTQLRDERQFDFITAFERIVQQARADRDAASLLPKALRSFCAVVCHHIGLVDHYPPELQHKLRGAIVASLGRIPADPLRATIANLDVDSTRPTGQPAGTAAATKKIDSPSTRRTAGMPRSPATGPMVAGRRAVGSCVA